MLYFDSDLLISEFRVLTNGLSCVNLQHLDTFVCEPLPKRSVNLPMRVSSLQQVFWFFSWTLSISICVQFDEQ